MASYTVACNAIVTQLLNQNNYLHWSSRVKTYLLAKDLWDVVKAEPPRPDAAEAEHKAWTKKNSKALHAINISCGDDMFSFISNVGTAKEAWEVLEEEFKSCLMLKLEERDETDDAGQIQNEAGNHNNFDLRYRPLFNYVDDGDWANANKCLLELDQLHAEHALDQLHAEHALRARASKGETALHVAVYWGHVHIVKELVQLMTQQDLEIKTNFGNTPLGTLIRDCKVEEEHVMIEMARYMVEKNNTLLTIPLPMRNNIPVVEACRWSKWELGRYLYSLTPPEALMGPHGAQLITHCLGSMKMLDMAWDLLRRRPILAIDAQVERSPMLVLANTRAAFLSGTQLTCWQKWIYDSIHIKAVDLDTHDISINVPNLEEDQHKMNLICSVLSLFRSLLNGLLKFFGINNIYELKLNHRQILEILDLMGEVTNEHLTLDELAIVKRSLFRAIEKGHVKFVTHICKANNHVLDFKDESDMCIFQFAIKCHEAKIYNLIYGVAEEERNKIVLQW